MALAFLALPYHQAKCTPALAVPTKPAWRWPGMRPGGIAVAIATSKKTHRHIHMHSRWWRVGHTPLHGVRARPRSQCQTRPSSTHTRASREKRERGRESKTEKERRGGARARGQPRGRVCELAISATCDAESCCARGGARGGPIHALLLSSVSIVCLYSTHDPGPPVFQRLLRYVHARP